jgi:hypothetical protein
MGDKVPVRNVDTEYESKTKASTSSPDGSTNIEQQRLSLPQHPPSLPPHHGESSRPNINTYASQQYPYNMRQVAEALPDYGYGRQPGLGAAAQFPMQQYQHPPQGHYNPAQFGLYGQYPAQYPSSPGLNIPPAFSGQYHQGQPRTGAIPQGPYSPAHPQYYYYPDPYAPQSGSPTYNNSAQQFSPPGQRSGPPAVISSQSESPRQQSGYSASYHSSPPLVGEGGMFMFLSLSMTPSNTTTAGPRSLEPATAAIPRGPPRKPKQSGHALWVGNLPPAASIAALKDHFARGAKKDIESLFLIQKSNCAFVNYRTEEACENAVTRFHDSRFQGVRLVCRLRKSTTAGPGAPTGPGSAAAVVAAQGPKKVEKVDVVDGVDGVEDENEESDSDEETGPESSAKHPERFFVVKSLTLHDLEQSVRNGIWATQSHNEEALNKAFIVSSRLLIFT